MMISSSLPLTLLLSTVLALQAKRNVEFGRLIKKRFSNLKTPAHHQNGRHLVQIFLSDTDVVNRDNALKEDDLFRSREMTARSVSYSYFYSSTHDHNSRSVVPSSAPVRDGRSAEPLLAQAGDETGLMTNVNDNTNDASDTTVGSNEGNSDLVIEKKAGNDATTDTSISLNVDDKTSAHQTSSSGATDGSAILTDHSTGEPNAITSVSSGAPRTSGTVVEIDDQQPFRRSNRTAMIAIIVAAVAAALIVSVSIASYHVRRMRMKNAVSSH